MELTDETREKIKRLAGLTDDDIAEIALDTAEGSFERLVKRGVVISPSGNPNNLHMRAGRSVRDADGRQFVQLGEQALGDNGEQYAANTGADGKAGTAAVFGMDSAKAVRYYGDRVGSSPRRWRGGKHADAVRDLPDGTSRIMDAGIGAASGCKTTSLIDRAAKNW